MLREFRQFLFRGNLIDLAVAIVIGTAFGLLVAAFVADIITPIVAAIFGKPDFSGLTFEINGSMFRYGDFPECADHIHLDRGGRVLLRGAPDERRDGTHRQAGRHGDRHARMPGVSQRDSGSGSPVLGVYRSGAAGQLTQMVA